MIGHITYPPTTRWRRSSAASPARRRARLQHAGDRVRDRELPAPPGRQVQRVLRRQHLPADHARWTRLRPARARRRPDARLRARPAASCWSASPPTGAFAGALARDRQGAGRQQAPRELRRDRRAARHDAFLLDDPRYHGVLRACFDNLARRSAHERAKGDLELIAAGGAARLARARPRLRQRRAARHLQRDTRGCSGYGIGWTTPTCWPARSAASTSSSSTSKKAGAVRDRSFDVVLQLDTLQHLRNTEKMLRETARVGRIGIVSFPNFATGRTACAWPPAACR